MTVPTADDVFNRRGAPPEIDAGKVVAKPLDIYAIVPDLAQPRKIVPMSARGYWDGRADGVGEVLAHWHNLVAEKLGSAIDVVPLLHGQTDEAPESKDPLVLSYLEFVRFAQTIFLKGLRNPIEVYRFGPYWKIQDGERRWLAHHFLTYHLKINTFTTIPAIDRQPDVWAQAIPNNARSPLNAIGQARQLARLIMAMYEDDLGVSFDAYEMMVLPGEIDRKFYAQVRDGNSFRIKKGMGQRIEAATGIPGKDMVSRYRALLDISDELWQQADEENWSENAIRDEIKKQKEASENPDRLTVVNLSASDSILSTGEPTAPTNPHAFKTWDRVRTAEGIEASVEYTVGKMAFLKGVGSRPIDTLTKIEPHKPTLSPAYTQNEPTPATSKEPAPAQTLAERFPIDSCVYYPKFDVVGQVVAYKTDKLLIVRDVSRDPRETTQLWVAADVRTATMEEIDARWVDYESVPGAPVRPNFVVHPPMPAKPEVEPSTTDEPTMITPAAPTGLHMQETLPTGDTEAQIERARALAAFIAPHATTPILDEIDDEGATELIIRLLAKFMWLTRMNTTDVTMQDMVKLSRADIARAVFEEQQDGAAFNASMKELARSTVPVFERIGVLFNQYFTMVKEIADEIAGVEGE